MKIAVCDDNRDFLNNTVSLIERWGKQNDIKAEIYPFDNGDALLDACEDINFDIIFLDIIMPLLNGMDTARELRTKGVSAMLVFLTSSPEFALQSYEVKAEDYILKPVTAGRLNAVLDECARRNESEPESIVLRTHFGYQKVYFKDIEYVEAQNKKALFYIKNGDIIESLDPLLSFSSAFTDRDGFFKCHRSYLVYIPNVDRFNAAEIVMRSGRTVPIARGYAKAFKEAYFNHMFRE